jgi:glucose/arabinose dehydrogenase
VHGGQSVKRIVAATLAALAIAAPVDAATIKARPVATGLAFPAAFTFAPDGRIFYAERLTGRIRIFNPATGSDSLFFTVPNVATSVEQGLLGLALHPAYPLTPYVYAYVTRTVAPAACAGVAGPPWNQIVRIIDARGVGSRMSTVFCAPAADNHNGGRILFGPDGKLYAVIGENAVPANSQDLTSKLGKVLRMTPSGTVPSDNPFPGRYAYAYGIRNSFGFAFDPQTGRLWETENGPRCNDELNRIVRGGNFGWGPSQTCTSPPDRATTNRDGPNPILPQRWWGSTIAPTGAAFCASCRLGSGNEGRLFIGSWKTREIRRITLGALRWGAVGESLAYTHSGGVLSLEAAPDGALYFSDPRAIYKLVLSP